MKRRMSAAWRSSRRVFGLAGTVLALQAGTAALHLASERASLDLGDAATAANERGRLPVGFGAVDIDIVLVEASELERHPIMLDHMRRSLRRRDTGGIRLA